MKTEPRQPADDLLKMRAAHWPDAVTPITELMVRIYRLGGLVLDNTAKLVTSLNLTFTEFEVLVTLRGMAPPHQLSPTDLYTAILISSGGLTKVLHALQTRGLIARDEGKTDRRSKPIRLTAKGRALAERAMATVLSSDAKLIFGALSQAEVIKLIRLLRKLLTALEPGSADIDGNKRATTRKTARTREPRPESNPGKTSRRLK